MAAIAEFCGFESGEVVQGAMTGAVVQADAGGHPAHWAPGSTRLCHLDEKEYVEGNVITLTDHYAVMFYFRTDNVDDMAASALIAQMYCATDDLVHWRLQLNDGGGIALYDANGALLGSAGSALVADTWYRFIIAVDLSDSGVIGCNRQSSPPADYQPVNTAEYSGKDLKACAHTGAIFKHMSPATIGGVAYNSWISPWVLYTGLTAADPYEVVAHNLGSPDVEVLPVYAINKAGVTPDSGDDLDAGAWDNMDDVPSGVANAEYTSKGDTGLCYCDDADEGPKNDANVTRKLVAMSWLFRVKKLASAGTRLRYGKYDGSTETDTDEVAGTRHVVYAERGSTYCPTKDEWATLGIASPDGAGVGSWGARLLHAAALHACNPYPTEVGIGSVWGTGRPVIAG